MTRPMHMAVKIIFVPVRGLFSKYSPKLKSAISYWCDFTIQKKRGLFTDALTAGLTRTSYAAICSSWHSRTAGHSEC